MRPALFLFFAIYHVFFSYSQERCGTKPGQVEPFENWLSEKMAQQKRSKSERGKTTATIYEIPVVVHVIEPAEGALISLSDEQIVEQIKILTDDFRRFNDDASNTPSAFLPIAADTEIQFTLAKRDPAGNPTNGIVRKKGDRSNYNPLNFDHKSALRIISYWPPSHYLNIYVTNLAGFLGFASFPTLPLAGIDNEEEDLIFDAAYVDRRFFGVNENPTSFNSFGRTTTHEVGHYLGLRHIWGDGNCFVDDFVDDTPVADRDNDGLGLPCDFPNLDDNLVCDTDEMFQNYMDYTNDVCMNLFTTGQKDRMRTVLENAPLRIPLVTSPALEAPARFENDLAIFKTNLPFQANCSSEIIPEVEVINYWTDPITSYDVTLLINGTSIETINQTTSLDSFDVETITFPPQFIASTPSTITFEISNVNAGTDGNESNNSKSVTLTNTSSILTPYVEDFESTNTLMGDFGPTKPWEVMTAPTENPNNQALAFKAYNNTSAFDDATLFKTPIFDLTGIVSAGLVFRYAYARAPVGFRDGLAIKISRDCGATFSDTPLYLDYGDSLETATESATLFTPSGELDWKKDTISLVEAENNSNLDGIQFAFIGLNGGGNNIYLDDISVVQVVRNENDASLIGIEAPLVTCNETTSLSFDVRNVGFEAIDSIQVVYEINDSIATQTLQGEILTDKIESFSIDVPIQEGTNELTITLTEINGKPDEGPSRNSLTYVVNRDNAKDRYPLVVDFEYSNNWVIRPQTAIQLWSQDTVTSSRNIVLKANGFNQPQNGIEDWFISPELLPNEMDTAGISFKVSHAKRAGNNDRLRLLVSTDCGESFRPTPLFDAVSDSLAITDSEEEWQPESENDWKEFRVDFKRYLGLSGVRLAFVFTNGNGNNLYLDDINIGYKPETPGNPGQFTFFPNPINSVVNVCFSLPERDNVDVLIYDVSGRLVFSKKIPNALDQVYDIRVLEDFQVPSEGGFYFLKVSGNTINQTERLYIRQ